MSQKLIDRFAIVEAAINKLIALHRSLLERFARQGEVIDAAPIRLDMIDATIRELIEEVSKLDQKAIRLEQLWLMVVSNQLHSDQARQHASTIKMEHDAMHITRMLATQVRKLNTLKEQAAMYGAAQVPVYLVLQIEETEKDIERIRGEL